MGLGRDGGHSGQWLVSLGQALLGLPTQEASGAPLAAHRADKGCEEVWGGQNKSIFLCPVVLPTPSPLRRDFFTRSLGTAAK